MQWKWFLLLVVAVHSIDHSHLRTSTPYALEVSDGVKAEKENEKKKYLGNIHEEYGSFVL